MIGEELQLTWPMILSAWIRKRATLFTIYIAVVGVLVFCFKSIQYCRELDYCAPSTPLDDTKCCRIGTIEDINASISPNLSELLSTSFFRYYKINLNRPCPFWKEDLVCTSQGCAIATLPKDPNGWEAKLSDIQFPTFQLAGSAFHAWEHDDDDFCQLDREGESGVYVDLIENPERFTGYSGPSANRVWQSIYQENCFSNGKESTALGSSAWEQCVERQIFYRVVSGLHASISVHLADQFYNQKIQGWESNFDIFHERVGKFIDRVQNLYMLYMLVYRAVCRLSPKIQSMTLNPNDPEEDAHIKNLLYFISSKVPKCPKTFDQSLFSTDTKPEIIEEFKDHFRNVTRIMNCVSCERCRLWGKIQTTGVGTALKILFLSEDKDRWETTSFRRSEIIALYNTLGRISESISAVTRFRDYHERLEQENYSFSELLGTLTFYVLHPFFATFTALAVIFICAVSLRPRKKPNNNKHD